MKCLIKNDFFIAKSNWLILIAVNIVGRQYLSDFLYSINRIILYSNMILVLYSDFQAGTVFFYTLFPRKRNYMIMEKNVVILLFSVLTVFLELRFGEESIGWIMYRVLVWWTIGSVLIFFFFLFNLSYSLSFFRMLSIIFIYIIQFCVKEDQSGKTEYMFFLLILIFIFNGMTSKIYGRKDLRIRLGGE